MVGILIEHSPVNFEQERILIHLNSNECNEYILIRRLVISNHMLYNTNDNIFKMFDILINIAEKDLHCLQ